MNGTTLSLNTTASNFGTATAAGNTNSSLIGHNPHKVVVLASVGVPGAGSQPEITANTSVSSAATNGHSPLLEIKRSSRSIIQSSPPKQQHLMHSASNPAANLIQLQPASNDTNNTATNGSNGNASGGGGGDWDYSHIREEDFEKLAIYQVPDVPVPENGSLTGNNGPCPSSNSVCRAEASLPRNLYLKPSGATNDVNKKQNNNALHCLHIDFLELSSY